MGVQIKFVNRLRFFFKQCRSKVVAMQWRIHRILPCGGVDFVNGGGGGGRKSLKVLKVKVKVIL